MSHTYEWCECFTRSYVWRPKLLSTKECVISGSFAERDVPLNSTYECFTHEWGAAHVMICKIQKKTHKRAGRSNNEFSCRSLSAKEPLIMELFCRKCKIWKKIHERAGRSNNEFSCRSLSAKEPLIIELFCGKCKIRWIQLCHTCEWR